MRGQRGGGHWRRARGGPHRGAPREALRAGGAAEPAALCARCLQPEAICVCHDITPLEHRIEILILQHPQERKEVLGTARLASLCFAKATLQIGLSWRSLADALGRAAEPRRWAVLYLGSATAEALAPGQELVLLDGKGRALADAAAALREIDGIVLLDGSWSQAKTLWWRNAWMLKCRRLVLGPLHPSRYGALRREPRRDALSTLEAAALAIARLEARPEIEAAATAPFQRMLDRYRALSRRPAAARESEPG